MQPIPASSVRLLQYQSNPSMSLGAEVIFDQTVDIARLFEDLQWLVAETGNLARPDFFVVDPPMEFSARDLERFANSAAFGGVAEKICLVIPLRGRPPDKMLAGLATLGIRILFGGIGLDSRFADLVDAFADGIVFDPALISKATGDPHAASVLEAASGLAMNLGLRTFANRCRQASEVEVARNCGVDYLGLHETDARTNPAAAMFSGALSHNPSPYRAR